MTLPIEPAGHPPMPEDRARALIAFEAAHPRPDAGGKEEAISRELGITPARYWQLLARLITTDQALRIDPITTYRLQRLLTPTPNRRSTP